MHIILQELCVSKIQCMYMFIYLCMSKYLYKSINIDLPIHIYVCVYIYMKVKVAQSCLTFCDPMDYTVHGVLQARIVDWVAFPFSR